MQSRCVFVVGSKTMEKIKPVAAILIPLLLVCLGCGKGDMPDLGQVEGTVTLDDAPLANAIVTFQPEHARPSYGKTDSSGHYELVYTDGNNGAVLGTHTVTISTKADGDPDQGIKSAPETVPSKYNTTTELTATVEAGDNTADFKLESGGKIDDSDDSDS
jgi:hypothetical protein